MSDYIYYLHITMIFFLYWLKQMWHKLNSRLCELLVHTDLQNKQPPPYKQLKHPGRYEIKEKQCFYFAINSASIAWLYWRWVMTSNLTFFKQNIFRNRASPVFFFLATGHVGPQLIIFHSPHIVINMDDFQN